MKNNFIKIVLILSFVFNFYYHVSADEFNFEVTEIEIYQNGNLIKGLNGGTVTTDNNIEIIADNFEYNKITSLLEANGNVKLFDKNENITINSDVLFYLKNKEEIYTKGKSKAVNASSIEIDADDYFKYNKLTSLLEAKGNVIINDKENNMIIKSNEAYYLKNKNKFFTSGATQVFVQKKYKLDTSDLIFLRNQKILSSIEKSILKDLALITTEKSKHQSGSPSPDHASRSNSPSINNCKSTHIYMTLAKKVVRVPKKVQKIPPPPPILFAVL